jgi:hypothetical protein
LNTLSYADIPRERLSSSTSFGGVVQQIAMGLGVSISAALLQAFSGPTGMIDPAAFRTTFMVLAIIAFVANSGFLSLRPQDGSPALPAPA